MSEFGQSALTVQPHPHDVRIQARTQLMPDADQKAEIIRVVDAEIFSKVDQFAKVLNEAGQNFLDEQSVHLAAINEIVSALGADVRTPLLDGASSADVLQRYDQLRNLAARAVRALQAAESGAEYHLQRTSDPYGSFCQTWEKWPTLRPVLRLATER